MAFQSHNVALDGGLRLKSAGLVASDASGTGLSGGVAYVDLTGGANVYAKFAVVIDWTECEVASGDEVYDIQVFGCAATNFTTDFLLTSRKFGDSSVTFQAVDTPPVGRAILFCDNSAHVSASDGNAIELMRYIRLTVDVGGTIATGMNFTAYIIPMP